MTTHESSGPNPGDSLQVEIEKMAVGGRGIARHDGLVIFVDQAAPGDRLQVEVTTRKAQFAEAKTLEVLSPGPSRREPPCQWAGRCGGCNWQHLDEETQRLEKHRFVEETLRKFLPGIEFSVEKTKASPRPLHYRNRVQPRYRGGRLGYSMRGSHDFLAVDDCLIVEEGLRGYFQNPATIPPEFISSGQERIELRLDRQPSGTSKESSSEPFGFAQVNRFQNVELQETLMNWTQNWSGNEIWDLYAGSGNFTFPLNDRHRKTPLIAVEGGSSLVKAARTRIQAEGRRSMTFICSDVGAYLRRHAPQQGSLVVIDPPRAGADPFVMRALAAAKPSELIYISCHPVSLARDLQTFFAATKTPFKLARVTPFEMFPQTDHVETMAHLVVDTP